MLSILRLIRPMPTLIKSSRDPTLRLEFDPDPHTKTHIQW